MVVFIRGFKVNRLIYAKIMLEELNHETPQRTRLRSEQVLPPVGHTPKLQHLQGLDGVNVDFSLAGQRHGCWFFICFGGRSL